MQQEAANMGGRGPRFAQVLDKVFWYGFMLLLVAMSLLTARFDSAPWQWLAAVVYVFATSYFLLFAFGLIRVNKRAVRSAFPVLLSLALIPLWLFLQTIISVNAHPLLTTRFLLPSPPWFQPELMLSVVPHRTLWLMQSAILTFCWFLLCLAMLRTRKRLKQLLLLLWLIALAHAVLGLVTLQAKVYLFDPRLLDGHFDAARGVFVNRNHFAALLVLCGSGGLALLLYQLSKYKKQSKKQDSIVFAAWRGASLFLGAILIFYALVMSQSRAGLLAPLLVGGGFAGFAFITGYQRLSKGVWLGLILALVIVAALVINTPMASRIMAGAFSIGERGTQWSITWQAIQASPWFGYGGGSYATVFQIFRDHSELRQVIYNQSHNDYLHIWLEQGLVGLIMWLFVLVLAFSACLRGYRNSHSQLVRATLFAAALSIAAALLQAGVDFNLQLINLRCFFMLLLALIFAAPHIIHDRRRG